MFEGYTVISRYNDAFLPRCNNTSVFYSLSYLDRAQYGRFSSRVWKIVVIYELLFREWMKFDLVVVSALDKHRKCNLTTRTLSIVVFEDSSISFKRWKLKRDEIHSVIKSTKRFLNILAISSIRTQWTKYSNSIKTVDFSRTIRILEYYYSIHTRRTFESQKCSNIWVQKNSTQSWLRSTLSRRRNINNTGDDLLSVIQGITSLIRKVLTSNTCRKLNIVIPFI